MSNLQDQLAAIQSKLNAERELGGQKDADKIAALEAQEADITRQIMEQAQQERVQAQEEEVESIVLPYDFNEIFSDGDFKVTKANDMIIEVVKDVKRESNIERNVEVDKINAEWSDKLRAAADREAQLQRQNGELQRTVTEQKEQEQVTREEHYDYVTELKANISQAQLEAKHANAQRDAAVSKAEGLELLLSEKQIEIDTLRQEKADASAPKRAIDISPTDKLAQMVKETNDVKAARGLARWNQTNPELAVTPLEIPVFPSATPLDLPAMEQNTDGAKEITKEDFRNGDRVDGTSGLLQPGLVDENSEGIPTAASAEVVERRQNSVSRAELDAIVARVEALEAKVA